MRYEHFELLKEMRQFRKLSAGSGTAKAGRSMTVTMLLGHE